VAVSLRTTSRVVNMPSGSFALSYRADSHFALRRSSLRFATSPGLPSSLQIEVVEVMVAQRARALPVRPETPPTRA